MVLIDLQTMKKSSSNEYFVQSLAGEKNRPAIVYAHGGGCIGGTADLYEHFLAYMAVDCRVVVYNVDYRLAPETRCKSLLDIIRE